MNRVEFRVNCFIIFLILFAIEIIMAKYITQPFIRYWLGDFLVVIMIYYFLKSFIKTKPIYLSLFVLVFAFTIEFVQLTSLLDVLNLRHNKVANLILGNTFSISDLVAYILGIVVVYIIEKSNTK